MTRGIPRGFSLIELLIGLAIFAILVVMAMPAFVEWLGDAQVRNGAESLVGGLRQAMATAVRENRSVEFFVDPTTKTGSWTVRYAGGPNITQGFFTEGAERDIFTITPPGTATVTFTGIGIIPPANLDATAPFERIDVTNPTAVTPLRVLVPVNTATGRRSGIKICDPKWPASDPKGCPNPTP